jgi:hypothetical protein
LSLPNAHSDGERRPAGALSAAKLRSLSSWTEQSFAATLGFGLRFVEQGL